VERKGNIREREGKKGGGRGKKKGKDDKMTGGRTLYNETNKTRFFCLSQGSVRANLEMNERMNGEEVMRTRNGGPMRRKETEQGQRARTDHSGPLGI